MADAQVNLAKGAQGGINATATVNGVDNVDSMHDRKVVVLLRHIPVCFSLASSGEQINRVDLVAFSVLPPMPI